jgi:hypothetical protein
MSVPSPQRACLSAAVALKTGRISFGRVARFGRMLAPSVNVDLADYGRK